MCRACTHCIPPVDVADAAIDERLDTITKLEAAPVRDGVGHSDRLVACNRLGHRIAALPPHLQL